MEIKDQIHFDSLDVPMMASEGLRCTSDAWYGGAYGYVNNDNEWVIEPQFSSQNRFVDGVAVVSKWQDGHPYDQNRPANPFDSGMVDRQGNVILPLVYKSHSSELCDGLAVFESEAGYEYFDNTGRNPFGRCFEKAFNFMWGYAVVKSNGKWHVINPQGELVKEFKQPHRFDNAQFHEMRGALLRKKNGKYGITDWMGNWHIKPIYDDIRVESHVLCATLNGKIGLIDFDGNVVLDFIFDNLDGYDYGYAKATIGDKVGIVRYCTGELIVPAEFDECSWLEKSGFYARKGDKWHRFDEFGKELPIALWGLIDKTGNWVVKPRYTSLEPFCDNRYRIQLGTHWDLMDAFGNVLIEPKVYTRIGDIDLGTGYASVESADSCDNDGFINRDGKFYLAPFEPGTYSRQLYLPESQLEAFEENGLWGFRDSEGAIVVEPQFTEVGKMVNGHAPAAITIKN